MLSKIFQKKALPPPEWLYDRIMLVIEPELTTAQMPLLDEKYAGETEDERRMRMERYRASFVRFRTVLQGFGDFLYQKSKAVTAERRTKRRRHEEAERKQNSMLADDIFGSSPSA